MPHWSLRTLLRIVRRCHGVDERGHDLHLSPSATSGSMKILITSGGRLGTLLYHALKEEHDLRVLRRRPDDPFGASCVVGDVSRYDEDAPGRWQNVAGVLERKFPAELSYLRSIAFDPTPIPVWLDCSRAIRDLGYRPRHDFAWFVRTHRENGF